MPAGPSSLAIVIDADTIAALVAVYGACFSGSEWVPKVETCTIEPPRPAERIARAAQRLTPRVPITFTSKASLS